MSKSGLMQFFGTCHEVRVLLDDVRKESNLWLLFFAPGYMSRASLVGPKGELGVEPGGRVYLSSSPIVESMAGRTQNDLKPFEEGWVVLDIGAEDSTSLAMSSLAFKSDRPDAAQLFRHLHRAFKRFLQPGIIAEQDGKAREMPKLYYSRGAADLFRAGRRWAQMLDGKVSFAPADRADRHA